MVLHYLRKVSYAQFAGLVNPSGSRALKAADEFQNGGLSSAVLTHKTDFVVLADMEADIVKQGKTAVCYTQVLY